MATDNTDNTDSMEISINNTNTDTDAGSGTCYFWDKDSNTYTYTDATDGTCYFWDKDKNAWFPKIDDTFIAYYQMNYGFNDSEKSSVSKISHNDSESKTNSISSDKEDSNADKDISTVEKKRKIASESSQWFEIDDEHNTSVYVSNLPLDITETEFVDLMQKCGMLMKNIETGKMKVKLYMDTTNNMFKGDALCTYIKKESVDLALNFLDGYDLRNCKIKVEKARFTMKGNKYDPSLKPKKRSKKEKEKIKKMREKLFAWKPDKLRQATN